MRKAVVIIIAIAAALACSESKNDRYIVTEPLGTQSVEIPDTVFLGQDIIYVAHTWLGNSCLHFSHFTQTVEDNKIKVNLYLNWDIREKVCFDVITGVTVTGTFRPRFRGTYIFYFWQTEDELLRREVVVR